jgi:nanoRNase/pAp phosphatase (c-di-AMP/oligoRNAs hydrolase)
MKNQLITSQILDFFGSHQHFLITAARNFDGDAIGSAWALTLYLRSIGKTVTLANSLPLANVYHFL